ncbi:MAG: chemotaxis protein methyltransferase CheR [Chthoniobacter sp.]|jgi:chemotaxis protein methyltransferase CheR|nr:chemotaxis protein methyltransferase CheR [Chthoniobacter sp.]
MAVADSDTLLGELAAFLEARLGLHFPPARWGDLQRGLNAAALELGFDQARECADWFLSSAINRQQLELLAAHLTIGETYFFRDPRLFTALEKEVLPELIRSRSNDRRIRIWSAACCTGEEPYSLAIALHQILPNPAQWQVTILGTDVNPRFIKKAEAAVYGEWSFRGPAEEVKDRYFKKTPEGRYELDPAIRRMVSFSCLNLAEDVYPALANDTNAMDIVLCRNVLIYFSREQARKVAVKMRRVLLDGGWFFTSPSEVSSEWADTFQMVRLEEVIGYRKQAPPPPPVRVIRPMSKAKTQRLALARAAAKAAEPPLATPPLAPTNADLARRLANEGRLGDALLACERAIQSDKLVAVHHYLRGVILQEQGELEGAAAALRRALYLDQRLVVAHFALGNLLRRQARKNEATRYFENARELLGGYPPDAALPEADGITAGRLLAILTSLQETRA